MNKVYVIAIISLLLSVSALALSVLKVDKTIESIVKPNLDIELRQISFECKPHIEYGYVVKLSVEVIPIGFNDRQWFGILQVNKTIQDKVSSSDWSRNYSYPQRYVYYIRFVYNEDVESLKLTIEFSISEIDFAHGEGVIAKLTRTINLS